VGKEQKVQCTMCSHIWVYHNQVTSINDDHAKFTPQIQYWPKNLAQDASSAKETEGALNIAPSFYEKNFPNISQNMMEIDIDAPIEKIKSKKRSKIRIFLKILAWPLLFAIFFNIIFWSLYLTNLLPKIKIFLSQHFL
jgi:hypothetical protein